MPALLPPAVSVAAPSVTLPAPASEPTASLKPLEVEHGARRHGEQALRREHIRGAGLQRAAR